MPPLRHTDIFSDLPARLNPQVNPYVGELVASQGGEGASALFGPALKGKKGLWRDFFASRHPQGQRPEQLVLEIGVHKGRVLTEMAKLKPEAGFIGLDITFKRTVLTARRAQEFGLTNLLAVLGDGRQVANLFAPAELDGVVVFFPDPWLKKQYQRHNRLLSEEVCAEIAQLLKPGGVFWFKSDAEDYFYDVRGFIEKHGLVEAKGLQGVFDRPFVSPFEGRFRSQNVPTYEALWQKVSL